MFGPKLSCFISEADNFWGFPKQWEGRISKKRRLFNRFSRNSELEATWISLIGWTNKTSTRYGVVIEQPPLRIHFDHQPKAVFFERWFHYHLYWVFSIEELQNSKQCVDEADGRILWCCKHFLFDSILSLNSWLNDLDNWAAHHIILRKQRSNFEY